MSRKKATLSEPNETLTATPQNSTKISARPRRPARERLQSSVLEDLWSIWRANPRVPSVKSRRSWAISRNANPRLVDNWFLRRKTCAKKAGQPIPDGSYELPIAPEHEQPTTAPLEPEPEPVPDLSSDDTLVYPPDIGDLDDIETSSDTILDEDALAEPERTETPAYKEVLQQYHTEHLHSQPKPSSADLCAAEDRCDGKVSFEKPSSLICNQGRGKQSNTCILCSTGFDQDEVQSDSDPTSDPRGNPFVVAPHLDLLPDILSELSAIPFLFRTPHAVPPDNAVNSLSTGNWTIVEDELERLVNGGKLDFSFLDVPHLACMELLD